MEVLNQIIERLRREEVRHFKYLYKMTYPAADRKDLALFNYIRSSGDGFDEAKAIKKLNYSDKKKSNYYRLKHRLIEDIGDSLLLMHTHKNELYELLQFIELFYLYHDRNLHKTCLFYLRKAERHAIDVENYELLELIYANFIRLSADLVEIEPAEYIDKRERNAVLIAQIRELDDLLATLSHSLKISQNYGQADKKLLKALQQKAAGVAKLTTSGYSRNLQARIYSALSQMFLQQHNYIELEKLVKSTYSKFESEHWFDKSNHDLKLQMLTFCANALYKNNKWVESLEYAQKLGEEIKQFGKLHYEKYLFFYYNTRVQNYSVMDRPRGLEVLNEFEQEMHRKENTYYDFFIYLNRATLLYDMGRYKEALKSLVRLYVSGGFAKADKAFRFKIEVCELIITFESGETDTLDYRIGQVKKTFASLLELPQFKWDWAIVNLIEQMHHSANYKTDARIQKRMKALAKEKYMLTDQDADIIKYGRWLNQKMRTRQ